MEIYHSGCQGKLSLADVSPVALGYKSALRSSKKCCWLLSVSGYCELQVLGTRNLASVAGPECWGLIPCAPVIPEKQTHKK